LCLSLTSIIAVANSDAIVDASGIGALIRLVVNDKNDVQLMAAGVIRVLAAYEGAFVIASFPYTYKEHSFITFSTNRTI
jgi:hypothetical protein